MLYSATPNYRGLLKTYIRSQIESTDLGDWQELEDDDSDQSSDDEIVEGDFVISQEDSKKARSPRLLSLHCTRRCHR